MKPLLLILAGCPRPAPQVVTPSPDVPGVGMGPPSGPSLLHELPTAVQTAFVARYPTARVVASCAGRFDPDRSEPSTALTAVTEDGRILRLWVDGDNVIELAWTSGATFSVTDRVDVVETPGQPDQWFWGELRCLRPDELPAFEDGFFPGFARDVERVDLRRGDSLCFSFDNVYNNWQCFAYGADERALIRWGWQAVAD